MLGKAAVNEAALLELIRSMQQKYENEVVDKRSRGDKVPRVTRVYEGWFDGKRAIVRFCRNGEAGLMEIFYGGAGYNPLEAPLSDYHGHVIVKNGAVKEWLLPGPKDQRQRVR